MDSNSEVEILKFTTEKYKKYKYRLVDTYTIYVQIYPPSDIKTEFIELTSEKGLLSIKSGYMWNGPSGPAIDTPSFMRGSLVHDALYQLIREKHLDRSYRKKADQLLRWICIKDGMYPWRAFYVYWIVRLFGRFAIN